MSWEDETLVEIVSDYDRIVISGPGQGRDGVELSSGVKGLSGAPVEPIYVSAATQIGSTYKGKTINALVMTLAVHLSRTESKTLGQVMSRWRDLWDYGPDEWDPHARLPRMRITYPRSQPREVELALHSSIDMEHEWDPAGEPTVTMPMTLIGPNPLWLSASKPSVFEATTTSAAGEIQFWNPTNHVIHQTWKLTRGIWTIPDPSWSGRKRRRVPGGKYPNRSIPLQPITAVHGMVEATRDPSVPMFRDAGKTNVTGQVSGGYWLMHSVPPRTPKRMLPISYTGAPAGGARAELHQPRFWDGPWGGE